MPSMRTSLIGSLLVLALLIAGCLSPQAPASTPEGLPPGTTVPSTDLTPGSARPTVSVGQGATPQGRCGDGVCEGPENANNCPVDCLEQATTPAPSGQAASACENPNPRRAVVSQELLEWHDWLDDGGFEEGRTEVVLSDYPQGGLARAKVERAAVAARTGSFGYVIDAGQGEGVTFSVKSYVEKGEDIRFSFWARSPQGQVSIQPKIQWVEMEAKPGEPPETYLADITWTIGNDWTQVSFVTDNTVIYRYGLLSIEVGPNTVLHIDDVQVEFPNWRMAEYSGDSRVVGGIPVPPEPVAPVHMTVLIHIEDPPQAQMNEKYFQQQTAIMRELARVLHEHGGMLTIQPEEDWPMGAEVFDPGLLGELAETYGVVYSTHTHGPHCRDAEGRLRSYTDCNINKDSAGWDQTPNDYEYPYVTEYVSNLRELISRVSGTEVTDHNGNWEFDQASRLSEVGVKTWSAYKAWRTQRTYDVLINNPWRPTECNADADIDTFLTHDPSTEVIYIPGWGQAITRHQERLLTRMRPLVSQFIRYADPERVNTFYVVTHVGTFHAREAEDEDTYIAYDPRTGKLTYSAEFQQDLQYWDQMLTELIDPLVEQGYLEWTSLPEMGELYLEWEENCGLH
jgi:hypothetical protein